ncbi:junctional sarcoplasmic reticulum protein 1 [Bufo gargarizans]|uniref:junctional sarcoplasmic reticulum protein 1 n=1 Tax=Bufo gargarizans TaxID=30331 RepID=UPI001CF36C9F|nr:junctional sarcoplasmic reticulum protein 1 [Bufo gargarizans]XP_044124879.1 junctional sarcoplasmic reticulum protein 1 [Bufo gargarizans]
MKKKSESKSVGPVREEESSPWNGITLNRCLAVAAIAALLSMGFQVLQDAVDDDPADVEAEAWTPPDQSDELAEPWFFEAWFGSSKAELPEVEQPGSPDIEEPDLPMEEEEEPPPVVEEQELTIEEVAETTETDEESPHFKKTEERKDREKLNGQWGLKPKSKYMEAKVGKIKIATEDDSQRRDIFPFHKKPKELIKSFEDAKDKSYKEKSYQKKYDEKKPDHSKKLDFGKPYRNQKEEQHKNVKQDKGRKVEKEYKGNKQYPQDKEYKRKHDSRHYG